MTPTLQKAFDYYLSHQDEIVSKYNGKFVVIRGQNVIGVYDAELKAIQETQKRHQAGTFRCNSFPLKIPCVPQPHSRLYSGDLPTPGYTS